MKLLVHECVLLILLAQHGSCSANRTEYIPELVSNENITESDDESFSSTESQQSDFEVFNVTDGDLLRFPTPCETPRQEISYCVEISMCQVLKNVQDKKKYAAYVEASRCGPANENKKNFKVCCGKYNNFRNVSNSIEDANVLPKKCGVQNIIMRGRIFGGEHAVLKEYPWMARILHRNSRGVKSYGCAGFLIHTKYVITAGHCIKSSTIAIRGEPYSVVLGEHDTEHELDCSSGNTTCADPLQQSRILEMVVHPQYSETSKDHHHDIAILHLKKAVTLTGTI
ncbi:hypothetical protein GWI33_018851 [Rhynchophorus ferrugineus]|uniref:Peptidase S1 domain-containing protein n=1 Tax=Rhynchophorus ferrugineus TaxID=354439 RepID=A0A834M5W6_RHYFE|nr:hypothetical protein GWI33_018851 [Rhynchophorus ferrugineus]